MFKRNTRVAEEVVYAIVPAIAFYAWNEALDFFPVDLQQNRIHKGNFFITGFTVGQQEISGSRPEEFFMVHDMDQIDIEISVCQSL